MRFQHKILVAFLVLILVPTVILGVVSYHVSSTALKNKVGRETLQTLQAINKNLQMVTSEINSFSNYVLASQEVEDFLKYNQEQAIINFYSNRQSMAGMLFTQAKLDDLIIYSNKGQVYHFQKNIVPSIEEFQKTEYYDQIINEKGRPVWLSPVDNHLFDSGDNPFFIHGRVIRDVNTLENIGFLFMKIKIERLDDIFIDRGNRNSEEMIVNEEGKIIYHQNRAYIGKPIELSNTSRLFSTQEGTIIDNWKGKKSLVTYINGGLNNGSTNNFFLVSIKPWDAISTETKLIRQTTFVLVLVVLVFACFFNIFFLNRIVRFITEFHTKMKRVETGDLSTRMPSFAILELNHLANSFNEMVQKIVTLLQRIKTEQERKRKAEFQVLQNQINPHFLYNTLESINAIAVLNDQKDISKMTIHLGKLLRISINASDEVTVQDEVRHVLSYMEIQKVRFNSSFSFDVKVNKELYDQRILKLVLQPLIENVLIHAFDRKQKVGMIRITGGIDKDRGFFTIEDNGKGIPKDKLMAFYERNSDKLSSNKIGHGVMNVQERLRIYYGDRYGLMICSNKSFGTIIKLTFPLCMGEDDEI
jgi:two-component system sensor histidine kinase YesM